jgi:hypothetical protein
MEEEEGASVRGYWRKGANLIGGMQSTMTSASPRVQKGRQWSWRPCLGPYMKIISWGLFVKKDFQKGQNEKLHESVWSLVESKSISLHLSETHDSPVKKRWGDIYTGGNIEWNLIRTFPSSWFVIFISFTLSCFSYWNLWCVFLSYAIHTCKFYFLKTYIYIYICFYCIFTIPPHIVHLYPITI